MFHGLLGQLFPLPALPPPNGAGSSLTLHRRFVLVLTTWLPLLVPLSPSAHLCQPTEHRITLPQQKRGHAAKEIKKVTRVLPAMPGPSLKVSNPGPLSCQTRAFPVYYDDEGEVAIFKTTSQ